MTRAHRLSGARGLSLIVLSVLISILLLACGSFFSASSSPLVGKEAPDFTLKDLDGQQVSLSEFRGKPVLLNFWASWCSPCRMEIPVIEATQQQHGGRDLILLAVNSGEPVDTVQSYVARNNLSFPILLDEENQVSRLYRIRGIPQSFFIDRQGVVTDVQAGSLSQQQIDQYLAKIIGQ